MLHVIDGNQIAMFWESTMEPYGMSKSQTWKDQGQANRADKFISNAYGESGEHWLGAPNIKELNRRLKDGWPDGSDRLLKLATREINPTSIRRRRERADQGAELDIHAVYRGDLSRAWTRTRRRSGSGVRTVAILCNLGANSDTGANSLFWRGAAALKLTTALMEAGYNVAIYGFESGHKSCESSVTSVAQFVEIKAEDQPLDLDRLAALTAMPGYFRTALFGGIILGCDLMGRRANGGLGTVTHNGVAQIAKMLPVIPENAIVQDPVENKASAEAWIDKVMAELDPQPAE
jgi:hypothetical protein